MKIHPMIFSGPMVRALLEGRKSQTRRVLKPQPVGTPWFWPGDEVDPGPQWFDGWEQGREPCGAATREVNVPLKLPFAPGHLAYVREAWGHDAPDLDTCRRGVESDGMFYGPYYMADGDWFDNATITKRSPIHMPRWASRLTLEISDVRVQRVQDISEEDARAEGAYQDARGFWTFDGENGCISGDGRKEALRRSFHMFWDSINAKRPGCAWADNPWCCALTFVTHHQNVDELLRQREAA